MLRFTGRLLSARCLWPHRALAVHDGTGGADSEIDQDRSLRTAAHVCGPRPMCRTVERSTAGPLRSEWIPVKCDAARESCYDDSVEHLRMIRCGNRSSNGQGSDALDDEGLTRCDAVHRGLESRVSEGASRCSVCFNVWLVVGQRISMTSAAAVVSGPSLGMRRSDRRSVR